MANRVDVATLVVRDKSSATINKINAALKDLFKTARSLKSVKIDIKVDPTSLTKAAAKAIQLATAIRAISRNAPHGINITVNASGIQQATRQVAALRAQASRPITVATGAGARPPGGGVFGRGAANVPGRFSVYVIGGIIGLTASSMHGIASAIGRATREGIKDVDIGDASVHSLQLDRVVGPGAKKAVDEAIEQIRIAQQTTPGGALMNTGLIRQTMAETMPLAGYDPKQAKWLALQQIELIKLEVQRGRSLDQAREHAVKYIKALDLGGLLKDAKGVFDPVKAASYIDALKRIAPSIGKEFTGENVFQFMKYARQARYTATPETLMLGMLTSEEMGASSAGVALNQAVRQLLGLNVPKETLAQLEKHGLVTTKEVPAGTVGKSKKTKRVVDQPLDEEMLRANFWQFVNEKLIPQMRAEGLDPTNPQHAAKLAAKLTSTATARDLVTGAITRMADLLNELERAQKRAPGEAVDPKSMMIAAEGLGSQIRGVLGEAVNVFEPILIPGMQKAGNYMSDLARDMRAATEGDKKAQQRVEGTSAKLLAAAGGTALLMQGPIGQAIAAAAAPAGIAAGVAGAMAPGASQTAQSLAYAGISLNTAGQQLQAAAKMQGLAAVAGGLGAAAGGAAAGGAAATAARLGLGALRVGGYAGLLVSLFGPEIASLLSPSTDTEEARKNQLPVLKKEVARQKAALDVAKQNLAEQQKAAESKAVGGRTIPKTVLDDIEAQKKGVEGLTEALKKVNEEYERLQVEGAIPKGMTTDPFWKSFWASVQRDKPDKIEIPVVPVVPPAAAATFGESLKGGFSKAAERAQRQEQRRLEREQRTRFPKGVPIPRPRLTEAQREEEQRRREDKGPPEKQLRPPPIGEPEKKVEASAKTFAEALDRLRTTEPTWLSTYQSATKETPSWMTTFREASAETNTAGTKFASAATTLNDASNTNANSALKIIEANSTYVSTTTQVATTMATSNQSFATSVATLVNVPSAFEIAFGTGAQQLGNAGNIAADILAGRAGGIGSMIGNAAGDALAARASAIQIGVGPVPEGTKRPDTGPQ